MIIYVLWTWLMYGEWNILKQTHLFLLKHDEMFRSAQTILRLPLHKILQV
jgi:hypothetical protein